MANPAWIRDELILALDLYFREPAARGSKTHPAVAQLSELLNSLPIHSDDPHDRTYRNPNGVGMKLSNFLRFDPDYSGQGPIRGGKLEEEIWNTYANDQALLRRVASAIRSTSQNPKAPTIHEMENLAGDDEAREGRILTRQHKYGERQLGLTRKKGKRSCERPAQTPSGA